MSETPEAEPRESIRRIVVEQGPETLQPPQFALYQEVFDYVYLAQKYSTKFLVEATPTDLLPQAPSEFINKHIALSHLFATQTNRLIALRWELSTQGTLNRKVVDELSKSKQEIIENLGIDWPPSDEQSRQVKKNPEDFIRHDATTISKELHNQIGPEAFSLSLIYETMPRLWKRWQELSGDELKIEAEKKFELCKVRSKNLLSHCDRLINDILTPPELREIQVAEVLRDFQFFDTAYRRQILAIAEGMNLSREDLENTGLADDNNILFEVEIPSKEDLGGLAIERFVFFPDEIGAALPGIAQNIAKAMLARTTPPEGGPKVKVIFRREIRDDGKKCVEIIVQDNGVGLPEGTNLVRFADGLSYWPEGQKGLQVPGTGTGNAAIAMDAKRAGGDFFLQRPTEEGEEGAQTVFQFPIVT